LDWIFCVERLFQSDLRDFGQRVFERRSGKKLFALRFGFPDLEAPYLNLAKAVKKVN